MSTPTWDRRPYWHATMPVIPRADGRPLPGRADVVVIGGGYTGLVAALQLARGGARVTLLEKEGLGFGASSRNGGLLHPGLKWGRASLERQHGLELGRAIFQAGIDATFIAERFIAQEGFPADYRRAGLAVLAWSTKHLAALEEELDELRDGGLTGRMLRGAQTREELGSDLYPGGYVIEEAGMIHPGRYVAALAAAAADAGVDLHTGLPAEHIVREGVDRIVFTARGRIRARAVLLATNGYTDGAAPWVRQRLMPIGSYIIATEPMSEDLAASVSPRGRTFFDSKAFLYYWHVNGERRLIFGGRASFRRTSVDQTAAILARAMVTVHPQTAALRIDHAWGGNVAFTFDRLPHLGEHDGLHHALGYCGSGVALGTAFGLAMAQRLGAASDTAREPSPFERTPFPGAPFVTGAYRGRPWFLPIVGEWFRLTDRLARRGTYLEIRVSDPLDRPAPSPGTSASPDAQAGTDPQAQPADPASPGPAEAPTPGHRPSGSTTPPTPTYKGEPLDAERGPGLGCFWIQVVALGTLLVLTPLTVVWAWDERVSAALLILTLILLLFAGQTVIFLLRLVAADRRTRRRPLDESARKTVGQLEEQAAIDATTPPDTDHEDHGPTAAS